MSNQKKQQTEIIVGSYIYDDVRMAIMLGSTDAVLEFESLLLALKDSMIRTTFQPDNYLVDYHTGEKTITLNYTAAGFLLLVKNVLIDFGMHAKATLSEKLGHTTEAVVGAATNVRRFDILDDENAMGDKTKLRLHPRHMQGTNKGTYGWMDKAWEAYNNPDDEIEIGDEVQISPVIEEQIRLYLWAISEALETDYLYRRYRILEEKVNRVKKAGQEIIDDYKDMLEEAVREQGKQRIKMTQYASSSLVELRQVIRLQKMAQDGDAELEKKLNDPESAINRFTKIIERGEKVVADLQDEITKFEKVSGFVKGNVSTFLREQNKIRDDFYANNIDFLNINKRFGIEEEKTWIQRLMGRLRKGKNE